MEAARDDPDLVVGLDFAFSLPIWFLDERNLTSARELWGLVDERGEEWLERCEPPFWGRPDTTKPDLPEEFRRTERAVQAETGSQPKSPFQIGGAGAVGTASIRGMPHLRRLSDEGFSVWPFEEASLPLVVEIYPRLFTGDVVKSDADARRRYLEQQHPDLPEGWWEQAAESADALDAAVSALSMDAHAGHLRNLSQPQDRTLQREGIIWRPGHAWTSNDGLEDALVYAFRLHADQRRKGPDGAPYIAHLLGVCSRVLEAGGDEEQAIAALLHDAAEDQGGRERLQEIRRRFGERVADIVEACTDAFEAPKPDWRPRKERYVADLAEKPADALLVACADKLYNARSILRDYRRVGDHVFERFTGGKEGTLWYYRALADAFHRSELECWLVDELERTVEQFSGRAARPASKADPDLDDLTEAIVAFRDDRDWGQFHSLRNLAAALSVEVGELQELFLWEAEDEGSAAGRDEVAEEIADVLIYTLLFCQEAGIDVEAAVEEKLETNREKYPVDDARGRAAKYTDLDDR